MENKKFLDYYNNKLLVISISIYFVTAISLYYFMKTKNTLGVKICIAVSIISAVVILILLLSRSDRN